MSYGRTDFVKELEDFTQFQFTNNNIVPQFPADIAKLREQDLVPEYCPNRKDFTEENAFTIDGDCKDMDDAVSIEKKTNGYRLAVHIADVAGYVSVGSELDKIASYRATSIYLPHLTVPMLPSILSNDLCSLNPGVKRNTLSVIMQLNEKGEVLHAEITKGVIRSRVKGVYSEINKLLSGFKDDYLMTKYSEVYQDLFVMASLYRILRAERIKRGATIEDSNKPKITVSKHGVTLTPTKEGVAENLIEEFMILANRVVAEHIVNHTHLPAIWRTQKVRNHMASYQPVRMHHAELALENYCHYTAPIRRIADLKTAQILTMNINGVSNQEIHALFDEQLTDICERATKRSRTARQVQEQCERFCYRQYFRTHLNSYTGTIVDFDSRQRPILRLNRYNIKVIGNAIRNGKLGDSYSFMINVSDVKNTLFAYRPQLL